jgi:serine phosphatase RsbU (regulator of sigma subunit)
MKLPFKSSANVPSLRKPAPSVVPTLPGTEVAAGYRAARTGGDFYDFLAVQDTKLLFMMLDIAGKRETALHIAAAAQDLFREQGAKIFADPGIEDSEAVTKLLLEMNRGIMAEAGGVRCAPAFLGCYDEDINTLTYINAGHTPAVLKDAEGTLLLAANGLPLGLFSHSTHDSQFCALEDGAVLVLVSRGVIESKGANDDFGIQRVQDILSNGGFSSANAVCQMILQAVESHQKQPSRFGPSLHIPGLGADEPNDVTTLALMRSSAASHAAGSST